MGKKIYLETLKSAPGGSIYHCMYFLAELNTSKILFFPHVINEWNKLDLNIRCFSNYHIFRNALLKFIRPIEKTIFNINDLFGIKMLARLRLGFSHHREHKFRHSFKGTLNPLFPVVLKLK